MNGELSRVLLVDDNASLLENLTEILGDAGYQTLTAATRRTALVVGQEGFDVALVDLRLPDGDGTALAAELKQLNPDAEIVLLTGYGTVETAADAVRAGAFAYLLKPCAGPQLLLTVEQALRQMRLHAEKRELVRRAHVAEKLAAVGTMTAGLSHEIRNPLNAAGLQLSVLERRIERLPDTLRPPLLDPLKMVREEIRRLDHILEDFLQFARPRELEGKPVDLAALTGRVLDFLEEDAERRGIHISRKLSVIPQIFGDEDRLRQVIINLTLNGMEAVDPGGGVAVATEADGAEVRLTIEDTGLGIPEHVRRRLFEPFFTTKADGSGLGLSIVHAIVAQHSGTIAAEKGASGGARFVIRFPALLRPANV